MHKKIRQKYDLLVTREQDVRSDLDPEGLAARGGVRASQFWGLGLGNARLEDVRLGESGT